MSTASRQRALAAKRIAEEVMPGAVRAQIAKLGELGQLHQPMTNTWPSPEPACPECFNGIFAVDPDKGRPCGCWGLLGAVCVTCSARWPCATWQALIAYLDLWEEE